MIRRPVHSAFDAVVGFHPPQAIPEHAYAIVKLTYDVRGGWTRPREAEPLTTAPLERPPAHALAPHDDHALWKPYTDVIVLGEARFARATPRGRVSVTAGDASVAIDVIGPRRASWSRERGPRLSEPEPIMRMPMVMGNAYGGWDPRVPMPEPRTLEERMLAEVDHPGIYPRNPHGKGYLVVPEAVEDVPLPNLEDPFNPLTPDRLLVGDPARWWRQPRPVFLGFRLANAFGRAVHLGVRPWFPPPDDERMPEVAEGELEAGFLQHAEPGLGAMDPRFFHEAPAPLARARLRPGDPVCVAGMHPDRYAVGFTIPAPPALALELEGRVLHAEPRLSLLIVRPADQVVTATWVLRADRLRRRFIPEVHAEIPLALRVDRTLVPYVPPPTLHARLAAAATRSAS